MSFEKMFRLDGEVALITGGATGLGFGIARCMVDAGAKVVLVGRRENELTRAVEELGAAATYVQADLTEFARAPEIVRLSALRAGGSISILVNNAGNHLKRAAIDTDVDAFENVMRTHVSAAVNLTRFVLPGMLERAHGNILFTASMASLIGVPLVMAYSAAKSAYLGITRTLAAEVSGRGLRVNAIAPGWIESPMLHQALDNDPTRKAKILGRTPMGGFGQPKDVGWAAVYLCSPAAEFITGILLPVDGGASIGF
jgi:NAD(P)-dependent dehydrogenase (short-subunit alcohol dehydrogenase family)